MKLPLDLLEKAESEFPKSPGEVAGVLAHIASTPAQELDGQAHFELRRSMIVAAAREPVDLAFERYIGRNDLVGINYLQIGAMQSRAVGRIRYFDKREHKTAYATGFMVSPELMLTNHHVFPVADSAAFAAFADDASIEFDFEFDVDGKRRVSVVHALDPVTFLYTFQKLDLALVAVRSTDTTGQRELSDHGYLVMNGAVGKAGTGDFATIVQHPDGQEKQIALRNNEIIDNDLPDVLVYKSDTAQGSSGAPVFNNEWQIIALHSAGVAKKNAAGDYLDKDDQIIETVNDRIDEARVVWLSNRGIRVSALMRQLTSTPEVALHPLGKIFSSSHYSDSRPFSSASRPQVSGDERTVAPAPAPSPVRAVSPTPPLEIRITIGSGQPTVQTSSVPAPGGLTALVDFEKKLEDERDYSGCLGFDEDFMGVHIPMPAPSAKLRKKLAFLKDNPSACILKYHHFSTFHHAIRRVPVVSAINVHGKYRYAELDDTTRKDNWLRDNRIDYDAQLDDRWYAKSGFDKGHLSRREDAEWGTTMEAAQESADMTCSYANAAPQVPAFNRAIFGYHGKWGQLEQKMLEEGVELQAGKSSRICVFSGPLFLDDDPVYASVQVALSCFKVVAWYDKGGKLRATGYRLSQESLVGGIEFEALHFDQIFKLDQKPLAWIANATGLAFPKTLMDADTNKA